MKLAYTVAEVAEMLGCCEGTVRKACREGRLPTVSFVGRRCLVPAHGLEEFVARTAVRRGTDGEAS